MPSRTLTRVKGTDLGRCPLWPDLYPGDTGECDKVPGAHALPLPLGGSGADC
jgi:hypothetical protein